MGRDWAKDKIRRRMLESSDAERIAHRASFASSIRTGQISLCEKLIRASSFDSFEEFTSHVRARDKYTLPNSIPEMTKRQASYVLDLLKADVGPMPMSAAQEEFIKKLLKSKDYVDYEAYREASPSRESLPASLEGATTEDASKVIVDLKKTKKGRSSFYDRLEAMSIGELLMVLIESNVITEDGALTKRYQLALEISKR
ncbi:MAG: hypothetical protein L3J47_00605 [Sulfurovum sp.]|nr:hypothetical protein [Sulfurovum sp.]